MESDLATSTSTSHPASRSSSVEDRKITNFFDLSGRKLGGDTIRFDKFRGKVVLVENVASLAEATKREYNQMNDLARLFKNELIILGYPCNQFGFQENADVNEILNMLKHVRPGKGFKPQFILMDKIDVNGYRANSVFRFLKSKIPFPKGEDEEAKMVLGDPKNLNWLPVCRNDLAGNFEKFLIDRDGVPYARYSSQTPTVDLKSDIEKLLRGGEKADEISSMEDAMPYYIVGNEKTPKKVRIEGASPYPPLSYGLLDDPSRISEGGQ